MICLGNPTYKQFERITHCWNRLNESAVTFNPIWETYRFNYLGNLYRLIPKVKNKLFKDALLKEMQMYSNSVNEMIGGVYHDN